MTNKIKATFNKAEKINFIQQEEKNNATHERLIILVATINWLGKQEDKLGKSIYDFTTQEVDDMIQHSKETAKNAPVTPVRVNIIKLLIEAMKLKSNATDYILAYDTKQL